MSPESDSQTSLTATTRDRQCSHRKIVILTDGYSTPFVAKTAISLLRYRTADVVAVVDKAAAGSTTGDLLQAGGEIPVVHDLGQVPDADALYIGIAPPGGKLPTQWRPMILEALGRGLDVVSGLHDFLTDDDEYISASKRSGARLVDIRRNKFKSTASCHAFRTGSVRIHSVGHDCTIGKMVAAIETQRGLKARQLDAKFLATGQTGIMISGEGLPIDCVVADFVSGAAEQLAKENEAHDYLLIEGQGSISHPAFSAVTLGLLHGTAPHGLIFCYEAGRTQVKGLVDINIPPIEDQMAALLAVARLRHPCRFIGIAVNTRNLSTDAAKSEIRRAESMTGLPACDVYRDGAEKLVDACIALRNEVIAS